MKFLPLCVVTLSLLICSAVYGQVPTESYLRQNSPPTDGEKIQQVIDRAEAHFKKGKGYALAGKNALARSEFDKATDSILESGMAVRAHPRLQKYYLDLVERIYNEEVKAGRQPEAPQVGFVEQKFEPSPLDELSKLVLTPSEVESDVTKPCNLDGDIRLELRGFHIGMSLADVRRQLPSIKTSAPNKYGHSSARVALRRAKPYKAALKDVQFVGFDFLDGHVSSVTFFYDNLAKWENSRQFSAQVASAMNLQGEWQYFRNNPLDDLRMIRCERIKIVAGLAWVDRQRLPVVSLRDESAETVLARRVKDEALKKQRAAEERRKQFKP